MLFLGNEQTDKVSPKTQISFPWKVVLFDFSETMWDAGDQLSRAKV